MRATTDDESPFAALSDRLARVCVLLIVYVPVPPTPVPSAVIFVPIRTPEPEMVCPTASESDATAVTVIVVPPIDPVTVASGVFADPISSEETCAQAPSATTGGTYRVA